MARAALPLVAFPAAASSPALEADSVAAIRMAIAGGRANCVAIVTAHLQRIAARDEALRSIVAVDPRALAEARRIDHRSEAWRRHRPLLCAPLLVKDNIDVAGLPTTAGSVALAANVARRDAAAVARLRRAGAIVIAKTNMSEFAFNYRGRSSVRGQTTSPFAIDESAGGSSSGNGAALAAGIGVLALGTDTSGSLRVPAALTGTIGLRPTYGRLPMRGVVPLSSSQDVIGPMCRRVEDCAVAMAVLTKDRADFQPASLLSLKVGVLDGLMAGDVATAAVAARALATLTAGGARVNSFSLRDQPVLVGKEPPPGHEASFASRSAFDFPVSMNRYLPHRRNVPADTAVLRDRLATLVHAGRNDPAVLRDVETFIANRAGAAADPRFRVNGRFRDRFVGERMTEAFDCQGGRACVDVLIYPSVQSAAAPAEKGPDTAGTHRLAAYSGYPAIALPIGMVETAAGPRPVSLELLGRPGWDARLMAIAATWRDHLATLSDAKHNRDASTENGM